MFCLSGFIRFDGISEKLVLNTMNQTVDSIIPAVDISRIAKLLLTSVTVQTGLSLAWSQPPKTGGS